MNKSLEIPINIGKGNVVTENTTPINENKDKEFNLKVVQEEVTKYLKNLEKRNSAHAKENISKINNKEKIDNRLLRTPETEFQNILLRIVYQRNIPLDQMSSWVKRAFNENQKGSLETQEEIDSILAGVESCNEAVKSIESELKLKYKEENIVIATNNELDARYMIDLIAMAENKDGSVKILSLIQVKSSLEENTIENVINAHQQYINSLPQLIGILNAKEAPQLARKETEKDIIDIDHHEEKAEQLMLFGDIFDQYINNTKESKNLNASIFYKLLREKGGLLNPFTVMGILKSPKALNDLKNNKYFTGDIEKEKYLTMTADKIPYTEAESIAFYKKNHSHTLIDSANINSIVMIAGKKVSEKELKHPYSKEK